MAQCCYPCAYGSYVLANDCEVNVLICGPGYYYYCVTVIEYYDLCGNVWYVTFQECDPIIYS
ncbi:MAG TPA: hypothetical protein VKV17_12510 [Bryobacteraceae bacterium]|nr:hypothetical protein [Bryobacteraceae bacterium]